MAAPVLIFIRGPAAGKRLSLDGDELTIGRSSKSDVVLKEPAVSRVHAILMQRGGATLIEDLGSVNGTYVNEERLHSVRQLHHGDRIAIGSSKLMFEDPGQLLDAPTQAVSTPITGQQFTQRQIQVLRLAARGLSNKQIGERLFVSERTVKAYMSSIFEKLGVQKRAAAVAGALRLGLIDMPGEGEDDDL